MLHLFRSRFGGGARLPAETYRLLGLLNLLADIGVRHTVGAVLLVEVGELQEHLLQRGLAERVLFDV